tara:strand:- start:1944 stop:2117 length:174 start_codon:yes stop_codon:yes gene_type:complete
LYHIDINGFGSKHTNSLKFENLVKFMECATKLIERYFLDEDIGAVEVRLEELLGKFR